MTVQTRTAFPPRRLGIIVMVVIWAALLGRTLGSSEARQWPGYLAGYAVFLVLMLLAVLQPSLPSPLLHVACAAQAAIVLVLLGIDPERDFVNVLFVIQCYEVAVIFAGPPRLIWVASLVALIGVSLVLMLGVVNGLALGLPPMAVAIVLATFVVVGHELEERRAASERIVGELRAAQGRLRIHAGQADELAALEQRARVARDLEDSVTGTLAEVLQASAEARRRLEEPEAARTQLERLQELTKQALAQMRRVITELRPSGG